MMEGHVGAPQISCNNSITGGASHVRQQRRKVEQLNNYGTAAEANRDQTDAVCNVLAKYIENLCGILLL